MSGIEKLREAELNASKLVAQARLDRAERLRTAKQEAQTMVEDYRQQVERQLMERNSRRGASGVDGMSISQRTEGEIGSMRQSFNDNRQAVVDLLVSSVLDVHYAPPAPKL